MKSTFNLLGIFTIAVLSVVPLRADVTVSIDAPEQQIAPGKVLHFYWRIENTGSNVVFLSATTFSLYGDWGQLQVDDNPFYDGVPVSLQPGVSWAGPLFDVQAGLSATNGLFFGSLSLNGGSDSTADDPVGDQLEFRVSVLVPPDPMVLQVPILTGDSVTLLWTGGPGIRLQTSSSLASPTWSDVPNTDGQNGADVAMNGSTMFFRLIRQ